MKKEGRNRKQKADYEDESANSEFGFEYEFFISGSNSRENKKGIIKEKFDLFEESDQSKVFFLPEYFESDD